MYPYKLGNYKKALLSAPTIVAELVYQELVHDIGPTITLAPMAVPSTGTNECHGVVTWVDYLLCDGTPSSSSTTDDPSEDNNTEIKLVHWNGYDFPPYLTTNVKFFPTPVIVNSSSVLRCETSFQVNDSDFTFHFDIQNS